MQLAGRIHTFLELNNVNDYQLNKIQLNKLYNK